jgi:hypothetical protein
MCDGQGHQCRNPVFELKVREVLAWLFDVIYGVQFKDGIAVLESLAVTYNTDRLCQIASGSLRSFSKMEK